MKISCVFLLFLLPVTIIFSQNIGENFEKGSMAITGSGYFHHNLVDQWTIFIHPGLRFFPADGVSIGTDVGLYYNNNPYGSVLGLQCGVNSHFVFGYDFSAKSGPAHSVSLSLDAYFSLEEYTGGFPLISLVPEYTFYFFLAPRVSLYTDISVISLIISDSDNLIDINTAIDIDFGISYHISTRDRRIQITE